MTRAGANLTRVAVLAIGLTAVVPAARGAGARAAYEQARVRYFELKGDTKKQRFRHNWLKAVTAFQGVYERFPNSPEAPRAAYTTGELWRGLYAISRVPSDLDQALLAYARVPEAYGKRPAAEHALADDALLQRAQIFLRRDERESAAREVRSLLDRYPRGDMVSEAKKLAADLAAVVVPVVAEPKRPPKKRRLVGHRSADSAATVSEVKHWSNADYTRVAISLSQAAQATSGQLSAENGKPERVVVDIATAVLARELGRSLGLHVDDSVVSSIRVAQFARGTVRVVLDLKRPASYRVMALENPHRIVVDAFSDEGRDQNKPTPPRRRDPGRPLHVVIDPGHGGSDSGAVNSKKVAEKAVVLAIAAQTAAVLEEAGIETTLTRTKDVSVSLEARTAMANRVGADAFVSIHANAFADKTARGIVTFFLDVTDDRYALRLAGVENQISEEKVSELQLILVDLSTKAHNAESMLLAKRIQSRLVKAARTRNPKARDLGVKGSLFYVLLGARMPSVLVETSFLSNPLEGKLLADPSYRKLLGRAIAEAVIEHLKAGETGRVHGG